MSSTRDRALTTGHWTPLGKKNGFSFQTSTTAIPGYGFNTTNNSGAVTGIAQSGGGENGIAYGLRNDFIVQADYAYSTAQYFDIWCGNTTGVNNLYVLFEKGDSSIRVGYVNASGAYSEYQTGILSGIASTDATWHNAAVRFNKNDNTLGVYVDKSLKVTVDLTTLGAGTLMNYSTNYVGWGADTEDTGERSVRHMG